MKKKLIKKLIRAMLNEKTKVTKYKFEDSKLQYQVEGCEHWLTVNYYRFVDLMFIWMTENK